MAKRHKWSGGILRRSVEGGVVSCSKCGMVLQYVKGKPTYFLDDNVRDKAMACDERLIKDSNNSSWSDRIEAEFIDENGDEIY